MSFTAFEEKLKSVKEKAEGDIKDLALYLEAAYNHVHTSHAEYVVKSAIVDNLHAATVKLDNIANSIQANAVLAEQAVETIVPVVKATRKRTTQS